VAKKKLNLRELAADKVREAVRDFDAIPSPRRKVRAYLDENIPLSVAERVRTNLRWDVLSVQEEPDLRNQEDKFHYANAKRLGRILFTLDRDFLDDRRFPLHQSPGVFVVSARQDDADDIFFAVWVVSRHLDEAYRKLPELHLQTKVLVTPEGQRLRYITRESEVHELFAPY
jgi:predicted nuclease of predicted toxin-antitoxin system